MRLSPMIALGLAAVACHEPDLAPVRQELATRAAAICAPAEARAPHSAKTRPVAGVELEGAIVKLCLEWPGADAGSDAFVTIHEGLAQDTALLGALRRSRVLIDTRSDARVAESCGATWVHLGRAMVESATALAVAGRHAEALARCADVIALSRDEHLAGNLVDVVIAQTTLELAGKHCGLIVDGAPKKDVESVASTLALLRSGFPTSLEATVRRDRNEMLVFNFARLRDRTVPYPCARAEDVAKASGDAPLKRSERIELLRAWEDARGVPRADARYTEAYARALRALDDLIDRASAR